MLRKVLLPQVELNMESVTVLRWLVEVNDRVKADQPIMEVETQKATLDVPSPADGYIRKLCVHPSDEISEKALLCLLTDTANEPVTLDEEISIHSAGPSNGNGASSSQPVRESLPAAASPTPDTGPVRAAPAARRLAKELGIDLRSITGTGPSGRITVEDVRAASPASSMPHEAAAEQDEWPNGRAGGRAGHAGLRSQNSLVLFGGGSSSGRRRRGGSVSSNLAAGDRPAMRLLEHQNLLKQQYPFFR